VAHQGIHCDYCDYVKELIPASDQVEEHPLHLKGELMGEFTKREIEVKVFHCHSCGSVTSHPADQVGLTCPFCGSENVNQAATETRIVKPTGLIPFKIDKKIALSHYRKWLTKGWFTPNSLASSARLKNIRGVYLPFWTFDAYTRSRWNAQSGYYYYETVYYTDAEGRKQSKQVQKVRWRPSSGTLDHFFDDVTVEASHGISSRLLRLILPYHLEDANNFDDHYLLGWETELYQKSIKEGFREADKIMDQRLHQLCAHEVPGDTHRFLRVDTHKEGLTFKHMLYPVWVAAYSFRQKTYQFVLNGQTAELAGKKPKSPWKIALAVMGVLALGILAYFLVQK